MDADEFASEYPNGSRNSIPFLMEKEMNGKVIAWTTSNTLMTMEMTVLGMLIMSIIADNLTLKMSGLPTMHVAPVKVDLMMITVKTGLGEFGKHMSLTQKAQEIGHLFGLKMKT